MQRDCKSDHPVLADEKQAVSLFGRKLKSDNSRMLRVEKQGHSRSYVRRCMNVSGSRPLYGIAVCFWNDEVLQAVELDRR